MSAARRPSSTARRTLLTATASGTLLAALWFVPSASAGQDGTEQRQLSRSGAADAAAAHLTTRTSSGARTASDTSPAPSSPETGGTEETGVTAGTAGDGDTAALGDTGPATGPATELADTGSVDTTPYVIGGTLFLALGAGFVAYSVRRERTTLY